ncbi:hypothetical protein JCM19236_3733 [Vibrio sp. JCM 19236]|nr:hypothetical protein JCM19236_3733 [Vibrio sp. JCM 19236]
MTLPGEKGRFEAPMTATLRGLKRESIDKESVGDDVILQY